MDTNSNGTQEFLTHFPQTVFQFFGDKDKTLHAKTAGKYNESKFKSLNDKGYGVYFTPQSFPSGKRRLSEPHTLNALYLDLDVAKEEQKVEKDEINSLKTEALDKLQSYKFTPHFVIETKNGLQPIWLIEPVDGNEENDKKLIAAIEYLIQEFSADPGAKDVARVLRLPGFLHQKDPTDSFECKLMYANPALPKYNLDKFDYISLPISVTTVTETQGNKEKKEFKLPKGFKKWPIHNVLRMAAYEAGIDVEFKVVNGKKQIIENGVLTSAFINEDDTWCHSMSGNDRKGSCLDVVEYYLKLDKEEALIWCNENKKRFNFPPLTLKPLTLNDVFSLGKPLGLIRTEIIEIVLATYISNFLPGEKVPVWILLVGAPASNKTTVLELIKSAPSSVSIDSLTNCAFASGLENSKDLLNELDDKVLLIKDYTALFSGSDDAVRKFIGELTNIYDGQFIKHSPGKGSVQYMCNFSQIGAITPKAMSRRKGFMSQVGPRFLQIYMQSTSDEERQDSYQKIWSEENLGEKLKLAISGASSFVEQLRKKTEQFVLENPTPEVQKQINLLGEFLAHGRGCIISIEHKIKNKGGEWETQYEFEDIQIEEPFRAVKQLKQLGRSLAVVRGKKTITQDEVNVLREVVLCSVETRRTEILRLFGDSEGQQTSWTVGEVVAKLGLNLRTARRHLDELCQLELLESDKTLRDNAKIYSPAKKFMSVIIPLSRP